MNYLNKTDSIIRQYLKSKSNSESESQIIENGSIEILLAKNFENVLDCYKSNKIVPASYWGILHIV